MFPRHVAICFVGFTVAIAALMVKPSNPVQVSVTNLVKAGPAKEVTVEFRRRNQLARFDEGGRVQARIQGRWLRPERFPALEDGCLLARTNCERIIFTLPRQTEACRFLLGYRVGRRPYCQAYFFLQKHGLFQKFPKLSHLVLKYIPQQPMLRHVRCDLMIPPESPNEVGSVAQMKE